MAYISADNGSLQPTFLAVMGALLFLSTMSVVMRLYCRLFIVHKHGLDDYLIVAALAITILMGIMNGFHVGQGTGRHLADLPLEKVLIPTLKHWYVYQMIYPLAIGMVKFSILAQYYRIFTVKRFRIAVICTTAFVFAYTIIMVFVNAFECHSKPWRAWDPSFPEGCNDLHATYFSSAGINIFTDLVILVMPLPLLMKLNLHRRRKYALVAIFLTGAFASVASMLRLKALYIYTITTDVSYDAIQILLWSQIEVNIAIVSASAPSLRPMFASIFNSSSYDRSYNYRGPSNNRYGTHVTGRSKHGRPWASNTGAIELGSRDHERNGGNENSVDITGARFPARRDGSQEHILESNDRITKTVVVEVATEHRPGEGRSF